MSGIKKSINPIDLPYNINFVLPDGERMSGGIWSMVPFQKGDEVDLIGKEDYVVDRIMHKILLSCDRTTAEYVSTSVYLEVADDLQIPDGS